MIRPGARVSREANAFLCDRFASAVDGDFAKQPQQSAEEPALS
jgi:hypothetical protein